MAAMSSLKAHRTALGLSLEQTAVALGLRPTSASWLSEIENGRRDASLRLALRIERWSEGKVTAASVCKELAGHGDVPAVDGANLTGREIEGAENLGENVSRTVGVAA